MLKTLDKFLSLYDTYCNVFLIICTIHLWNSTIGNTAPIASFSPDAINFAPDIDSYLSFVLHMFIAFGATFEVPVAVTLLASMNVVSLEKLKKFRRYLIVVAFAIAAVLTPPDIASQLLLALPIIILYEVGIVIATIFCRRKESLPKEDLA